MACPFELEMQRLARKQDAPDTTFGGVLRQRGNAGSAADPLRPGSAHVEGQTAHGYRDHAGDAPRAGLVPLDGVGREIQASGQFHLGQPEPEP